MNVKIAPVSAKYRAEFAGIDIDGIAAAATADQQAGVPLSKGQSAYDGVAERAHYHNAWLASIKVNGPAKAFVR
jgi:hypothetical protein